MFMETACKHGYENLKYENPLLWVEKNLKLETRVLHRELAEMGFLAIFAREVGSSLNSQEVVLTAAKLLFDYFRYNLAVFSFPVEFGGLAAFSPLDASGCKSSYIKATEDFPELEYRGIQGYRFLDLVNPMKGNKADNQLIVIELADISGKIVLFCGEAAAEQATQEILAGIAGSFANAMRNAHEHDKVKELSVRDSLTGLYNRRVLEEVLFIEESKRVPSSLAILLIDVDNFKAINDTFGHLAGDHVLSVLGKLLLENSRKENIVARYGGEEFAVLLTNTSLDVALQVAERLRNKISAQDFEFLGEKVRVTVSVGVSHNDGRKIFSESLLARADQALYQAKRSGKNKVCFHEVALVARIPTKKSRQGKQTDNIMFGRASAA
jgi:diguanylate cyclase (GGDEF)-like protein